MWVLPLASHILFQCWCIKAKQKAALPACFSQPNSSELLDTAVGVELGVHSVPGSWQMLQSSFNPKAAGYIFHWKKVILRKASEVILNTEVILNWSEVPQTDLNFAFAWGPSVSEKHNPSKKQQHIQKVFSAIMALPLQRCLSNMQQVLSKNVVPISLSAFFFCCICSPSGWTAVSRLRNKAALVFLPVEWG